MKLVLRSLEWDSLMQHWILDLDQRVRDVEWSIVTVFPSGPSHKVLIRLLQEVEKGLRGHVLPQNTLKQWVRF